MKNFERAYYEHYRTLWAIAVKMLGDEPAAEDVLQDVFTAYYQQSREDGRIRNPKSWLVRATVHKCSDVIAYRSRYVEIEQVSNTVSEDDALAKKLQLSDLQKILAQLSDKERQLAVLYSEGFSYREIADITQMRFTSVGKTLSRIMNKLYDILKSMNYEMPK